mmetsp:Transcript_10757/g.18443  ORF Transcript_10757/g.18443 Transcript_10757/m.18443 type:complete len:251 (-) Transcript_10757:55-807(-)
MRGGAVASYPGCLGYTSSCRSSSQFIKLTQRRLGMVLKGNSAVALVMMVCICARKKRIFCGGLMPSIARMASSAFFSCTLLILLFGKYSEYSKVLSGSQMSNSQTFFLRSSKIGREQKSSSHTALSHLYTGTAGGASASSTIIVSPSIEEETCILATRPRDDDARVQEEMDSPSANLFVSVRELSVQDRVEASRTAGTTRAHVCERSCVERSHCRTPRATGRPTALITPAIVKGDRFVLKELKLGLYSRI